MLPRVPRPDGTAIRTCVQGLCCGRSDNRGSKRAVFFMWDRRSHPRGAKAPKRQPCGIYFRMVDWLRRAGARRSQANSRSHPRGPKGPKRQPCGIYFRMVDWLRRAGARRSQANSRSHPRGAKAPKRQPCGIYFRMVDWLRRAGARRSQAIEPHAEGPRPAPFPIQYSTKDPASGMLTGIVQLGLEPVRGPAVLSGPVAHGRAHPV